MSKVETLPESVWRSLVNKALEKLGKPLVTLVEQYEGAPHQCIVNVLAKVASSGGSPQPGYLVAGVPGWQYIVLSGHMAWKSPAGELVDVTKPIRPVEQMKADYSYSDGVVVPPILRPDNSLIFLVDDNAFERWQWCLPITKNKDVAKEVRYRNRREWHQQRDPVGRLELARLEDKFLEYAASKVKRA
jgi:hypothetical protein